MQGDGKHLAKGGLDEELRYKSHETATKTGVAGR
jgi:hypothetical protein